MPFREDIKSPFNMLMLALAVIGVLTGFYFYFFPREVKEVAYITSKPSLIFDSSVKSPNLTLTDSSQHQITVNTYLITFTFWNSGSQPIESNDVRHPITVSFPKSERILDEKIIQASDQSVSGFSLSTVTNESSGNEVQLHWNHFDPRKGISFQVILCQPNEPIPFVSADIVGLRGLNLQQRLHPKWYDFYLRINLVVLIVATCFLYWLKIKTKRKFKLMSDIIIPLFFISFVGYVVFRDLFILSPPF
jgi:hypothetical protein